MKIHRLENSVLAVEVDLDTGVITQIIDKVNGSKHLLSRKPELEIRKPGMGVYVLGRFSVQSLTRVLLVIAISCLDVVMER